MPLSMLLKKTRRMLYKKSSLPKSRMVKKLQTAVSCDGSWQRRGFSSLHGCVTVISMESGKILDIEPLTKVCNECRKHQTKSKANYSGSSPAMEPEGAKRIFSRSISSYGLQYNEFCGDGDSKSFPAVENYMRKNLV